MKTKTITYVAIAALWLLMPVALMAQEKVWTLTDCINYALQENISVRKADVNTNIGQINLEQAKYNRLPNLSSSIGQNYSWQHSNSDTANTSTSLSLNSGITLFNGFELRNNIKKAEINYEALKYDSEQTKESVSLSLLSAYLEVLFAQENITTCENQVNATAQELDLAGERLRLGAIATSDFLQVKAQLASEKQTLAGAINNLAISKVTLMQLMELPITDSFTITNPNLDSLINIVIAPAAADVYQIALGVKPEVKSAFLATEESQVNLALAKGGYYPSISMNAGISTGLSGYDKIIVTGPLTDRLSTSVGITASIPIFSKWANKSSVSTAKANIAIAQLNEINVKNQLRKSIEQACLDASSAYIEYDAAVLSYESADESYKVAAEKYKQGLMNSVDFLMVKNTMISAESNLLQAKYQLIFSNKIIDFYRGVPLSL